MGNYLNISDDAQSVLAVITSNTDDNDILEINVLQTDELAERAGFSANKINSIAKELEKNGIAKRTRTGKELLFDPTHINEFRRQFSSQKPEKI